MSYCIGAGKPLISLDLLLLEKKIAQAIDARGITTQAAYDAALPGLTQAQLNAFTQAILGCVVFGPTPLGV